LPACRQAGKLKIDNWKLERMRHIPVLLKEVLQVLDPKNGEVVLDATFGGGGHAQALLEAIGPKGFLFGLDADAQNIARQRAKFEAGNVKIAAGNFADLNRIASFNGWPGFDIVLFDLGLSSGQLDDPARGFSFQKSGLLDMRLDQKNQTVTARSLVNALTEAELAQTFKEYGEEKNAKRIARAIVARRALHPLNNTDELFDLIKVSLPAPVRFKAGDAARRIFQALRIKVNDELTVLAKGLAAGFEVLNAGGRLAVISFHSLEDRIVKVYFKELARGCVCPPEFPVCICGHEAQAKILTPDAKTASAAEQKENPRSKSAKLRAIKKIQPPNFGPNKNKVS